VLPPALDLRKASRWLRAHGYRTGFRTDGLCECLLESGDERWLGHGRTRRSAFRHALTLAFPSTAARELFVAAIEAWNEPALAARIEAKRAPASPLADTVHLPRAILLAGVTDATPSRRIVPRISLHLALDGFDDLEHSMRAALPTASMLPERRQRLLLLSWVAHTRNLVEAAREVGEARERGRRIIDWARRLSKIWWPGTLRALDPQAAPADSSLDLRADPGVHFENWEDVACAAEDALVKLEGDDVARGFDGDGWADAAWLEPAASDPDGMLREIAAHLEQATTKLLRASDAHDNATWLVEWTKRPVIKETPALGWSDLTARVRWLRGHASDLEMWGAVVGRLRCIAERLMSLEREEVGRLLDPDLDPAQPWARRLGLDPERKALQRRRRELLTHAPEAAWLDEQITVWIHDAIELKELMTSERIALALVPVRDRVKALMPEGVTGFGRRYKRRLRDIQEALERTPFSVRDRQRVVEPSLDADDAEHETREAVQRELLDVVLARTRGKSALVVSNRNDPEQDREIQMLLLLDSVDHGCIEPRRVESLSERVEQGRYDFVLAATGFMPHKVDGVLRKACVKSGIPYVRMNRGRPRSCLTHIVRELGLAPRVR
jgi:hypothetical protein